MPPLNYAPGDIDALPHQTRMLLGLLGNASRAYARRRRLFSRADAAVGDDAEAPFSLSLPGTRSGCCPTDRPT